ncbi:sigma-70 family RNA polymerase sigma factor [Arthrobacter sp. JZ12]|uniref:RNA polymerase sigma factor n=1 Tax=Arthrobacter sp. JZ12 TaxID=2654190 RepID=UPI002B477325|nr:sigma-70 family RNA polymerase sigma factor [Arthrobacter sp. JZ12]WRH25845.1 sigma-70 family RNA polymerase sigma factor [Arthrobacter sp. JZ12]
MSQASRPPDREETFRALYESAYSDLIRFVQRRAHPDHAEDVVADAFLVVWRRLNDVPNDQDDARAWIYGITRNILLNSNRSELRRQALGVRLADAMAFSDDSSADLAATRVDLARAWHRLSEVHQEALSLAVLEELTAPQAAAVLGISPVAFRLRLSRARRALQLHLDHLPQATPLPAELAGRTPR